MEGIQKIPVQLKYRKDNGMFVLDVDQADAPFGFLVTERSVVYIPPQQQGGNHAHARTEAFICIGAETELQWLDKAGKHHTEFMNPDGKFFIFVVPPHVPHAIRNNASTLPAMLLEYASAAQTLADVTHIPVTQSGGNKTN